MGPAEESGISQEAVLAIIASQAGLSAAEIPVDRSLPDLGVSSFGIMRLVLALEDQFDMEFSGEALREFTAVPVSRLYELVERARASSAD